MAEVAAGVVAAEEVVSTSVYAGAAGHAVTKPTMPLTAIFTQMGSTSDHISSSSLVRSHHTLTILGDKAYIFGGQTSPGVLASNDIHSIALPTASSSTPEYQILPAIAAEQDGLVPWSRTNHSACAVNNHIAIYGGCDETGSVLDEKAKIWLYDTENLLWKTLESETHPERVPPPRSNGNLFSHDGNLILLGGNDSAGGPLADAWYFNCSAKTWNQLPHSPTVIASAAIVGDTIYGISSSDNLSSEVHHLDIDLYAENPPTWKTTSFPTNPLTPGPRPRLNGGLISITTGHGRRYLLYFFGNRKGNADHGEVFQWSDLWTFQLPSGDSKVRRRSSVMDAIRPAKIKDQIRSKFGVDTGGFSWAEVEVQPPGDLQQHEGKVHPGPRSSFGYDVTADGRSVVLWGGTDPAGEPEGDGWIITLS
ncbi:hypothetical protein F4781DRAFT_357548 [Annulohypoxylon bovei var. microspora]|nr:hypothetical protein F4781DRAFT_357548 [Annulohypoxylon bovei var. microspora]